MIDIHRAAVIAARAPDAHPFEVFRHMCDQGYSEDAGALVIALLHDAIEDEYSTFIEINHFFGEFIAGRVHDLTRRHDEKYFEYIERVKRCHPVVRLVKRSDLSVNLARGTNPSLIGRHSKALRMLLPDRDFEREPV